MTYTVNIFITLLTTSLLAQQFASPQESTSAKKRVLQEINSNQKKCRKLKKQHKRLCKDIDTNNICILYDDYEFHKALKVINALPKTSDRINKQMAQLLSKKTLTRQDIDYYFMLAGSDCWKATELKLWKSVSSYFAFHKPPLTQEPLSSLQNAITRIETRALSPLALMIRYLCIYHWAESGLIKTKNSQSLNQLKDLQESLKEETWIIQDKIDQSADNLKLDNKNLKDKNKFDFKYFLTLLEQEQNLVSKYSLKLSSWLKAETQSIQ